MGILSGKTCNRCGADKPASEFRKRVRRSIERVDGACKSCERTRRNLLYLANKRRGKDVIASSKVGANTAANTKRYKSLNRDKAKAHSRLRRAVLAGKIIRPSLCSKCGTACKPHGHHMDYTKPLEVIWLCCPCHGVIHREDYHAK